MKKQYVVKKNRSLMALCALLCLTTTVLSPTSIQAQSFSGLNSPYCSNDAAVTLTGSAAPSGTFSGPGITNNGNGTASFNPATAGTGGTITYNGTSAGNFTNVSGGGFHTLAVRADGTLWAWGYNTEGQLGIGNTTQQNNPVQVGSGTNWASVIGGVYYTLALKTDGTLWAWGRNTNGQLGIGNNTQQNSPVQVGTGTNWANVSAGYNHTLAIKTDGTLWAWGLNHLGQLGIGNNSNQNSPIQVGTDTNWASVSAGDYYTLALKTDGTLWAWGYNAEGQLGIGNTTAQNSPVQVGTDTNWASVKSAGHTLAIKTTGTLWAWGYNAFGQLGDGTTVNKTSPVQIGTDTNWASASAGSNYTIALKTDGTLWACGRNVSGQLGIGNNTNHSSPVQIGTDTNWANVSARYYHTLAIKTTGTLWAWGYNGDGELGDGTIVDKTSPVITGTTPFSVSQTVVVNAPPTAGLTNNGPLTCSNTSVTLTGTGGVSYLYSGGSATVSSPGTYTVTVTNASGCTATATTTVIQICFTGLNSPYCGNNAPVTLTGTQAPIGTFSGPGITDNGNGTATFNPATAGTGGTITYTYGWASVSAGTSHTLAIRPDGTLWAWGLNSFGQLGIGNNTTQNSPVQVGTATNWASVSAGGGHSLAIKTDGSLWAWGRNDFGQLGIGNNTTQNSPVQVGTATNWASASAGDLHTLIIDTNGNLFAAGNNANGQLGNGNNISSSTFVSVGSGWLSVSAGVGYSVGIKTSFTLWGWGLNNFGQLSIGNNTNQNIPVPTSVSGPGWVSVSAGQEHALGIRNDGSVWAWGRNNDFGQLGIGNFTNQNSPVQVGTATNWASIDADGISSFAIKTDGTLWAWGGNNIGQLGIGNIILQNTPVQVGSATNWASVSAGQEYTLAIKTNGGLWAWGRNSEGQLGIGNTTQQNSPVIVGQIPFSVSQTVVVSTPPTAGLTNNGPLTCSNTSVTLTGTGGVSYTYTGGSATVTTAGIYTVTVTAADGCTATATTTVISDTAAPAAPTLSIVNNTCPTTTGTISATGSVGDVIWYYTGIDAATASANAASNTGGSTTAPTYSAYPTVVYVCAVAQSANGCYSSPACGQTAPTYCTNCGAAAAAPTGPITSSLCQQGGALTGSTAADATTLLPGYGRLYLLVDNATSIIVDNQTTVAALTAPANTSNADKTYSVYSLVFSTAEFGTADITNGTTNIILGDAAVITDNDNDPLLALPTDASCMDLSPAAATTVTVNKAIVFEYSAFRICGNTTADVDLYTNEVGLQATWTASSSNGVTGFAQQPTAVTINPQNSFDMTEVLSNTTASTGTVVYVVTPQLGTCFGDPVTITREVAPNLSLAITSTTCNAPTYDVAFSVAGGTPGYAVYSLVGTVNYTPNNATGSVTGITSGTPIDVALEDSEGCTASASAVVTIPSAPVIDITNSVCTTGCAPSGGSFNITTACTTGTLTYYTDAMGAGATTTAPTYNQAGPAQIIYYACVDLSGCASAIQTSATTVPGTCTPVTAGITAPVTELTCTTTSVNLTATGGATYLWDDTNNTATAALTVSAAGIYNVTVTGANGCTDTESVTVTQNITAPTAGITAPVTQLTCTTTSATLTATGGATYLWDDNSTNAARTVSAPGTYTVIVTSANGCTDTESVTVTQNITAPTAGITAPVTELTCTTTSAILTATGGGTYTWDDSSTAAARTVTAAGTYTVTVTNTANGCNATATVIVTQNITAPTAGITAPVTQLTCTTTSATLTATGGATYLWDDNSTNAARTVSTAGTYNVTVTGANGCTATASVTVTQNITTPTAGITAPVTQLTYITTSATLTATGGATYLWDDNSTNDARTVTAAGTYTVTVTGANGCTATATVTVTQDISTPTAGITAPITELTCTTTSVILTATGGGTYTWDDSSTNAARNVTAAGTYTVTVTAANGGTATATVTVTQNITAPTAGITNTDGPLTCLLLNAKLSATGGGTYSWNTTETAQDIFVTTGGTYTVTVTGANGCTATATTIVTTDYVVLAAVSPTTGALSCTTSSVALTASGGGTYLWGDASTGATRTVTTAGTYTVTVTGTNGCTATAASVVTGVAGVSIATASNSGPACEGQAITLSVNPNLTAGVTATYLWAGGAGTATTQNPSINNMTSVKAGLYTVTVTYNNGCTATATTTLVMNPKPVITSVTSTCVAGAANITVNATGTGLTYNIGTGPQSSNVFNGVANGTYTVIVTNSTGCTAKSAVISVFCATCPTITASNNGPACAGGNLLLSVNPALPNGVTATYFWNGPGGIATIQNPTITNFSPGKAGVYTVTVTYSNGCTATASTTATIAPTIAGTIIGPASFCTGGSAVLTAISGLNYVWSTSATTPAITVTTAGTYVVTITNGPACKRVSKTVTTTTCKDEDELSQMQSLSVTPNPFAGRATIEFMTNSNGHTSINVYSIDGRMLATLYNANTQAGEIYQVTLDGANLPNGMYFVEMTNANGKKMLVKAVLSN